MAKADIPLSIDTQKTMETQTLGGVSNLKFFHTIQYLRNGSHFSIFL